MGLFLTKFLVLTALLSAFIFSSAALALDDRLSSSETHKMEICFENSLIGDPDHRLNDCIGLAARICGASNGGSTSSGMTQCAQNEMAWWDAMLNANYAKLRDSSSPALADQLRDVQQLWIAYRSAKCQFSYDYWEGGSIRNSSFANCMLTTTAKRAIDLQGWLSF